MPRNRRLLSTRRSRIGRLAARLTLFIEVMDIAGAHAALKERVPIVMPLEHKWYGVTEFAFADPDGYLITFAERDKPV